MHEVIMPDVLQIGMFKLLHGWITIICYLFTFKLLEVLFVDTMIQVAVMGHWWRYHQCHCRRRQQCLLKLYNLERLNPELCHWRLQCYVWEYYRISFQLSYNYYYFRLSIPGPGLHENERSELASLSQQWLWSPGPGLLKCQCIMPVLWHFHNGIWWVSSSLSLSGVNVRDSELPVSLSMKRWFLLGNSITLISQCICMVR